MSNLKDIVKDNTARLTHIVDGALWYDVNGFTFPVPFEDTKGAVFNRDEKAITLMRWIRKHLDTMKGGDQ